MPAHQLADRSDPNPIAPSRESLVQAHLGFAALLNGTMVDISWLADLRGILAAEVTDYFEYLPVESGQFNNGDMLALLDEYNTTGLLQMLHHLGKCPFGHPHENRLEALVRELSEGSLPVCERVGE